MKVPPPPPFEPNSADYKSLNSNSPSYLTPITTANASNLDIGDYQTGQLLAGMATSIGSSLSKLCPDSQTQSSLANIFKIFITVSIKSLTNADNSQGSYQYSNCIKDLETCSTQLQGPTTLQVLQNTLNVFKTVGSFVQGVLQINTASTNQMGDLEALMTSYFDLLYNAPPQSGLPNALITLSNSLGNALQSGICRLYPVPENCLSDLNDFIYYIQNVNTPNNTMNSYLNSVLVQTYVQDLYNVE